jgi:hypothetical protein
MLELLLSAAVMAQAPKPTEPPKKAETAKSATLAEVIAAAMTSNPDVRIAAAEVELARAKFEQVKMQTTAKIATAYAAKQAGLKVLEAAERQFAASKTQHDRGTISEKDLATAEVAFAQAKAAYAAAEAVYESLTSSNKPSANPLADPAVTSMRPSYESQWTLRPVASYMPTPRASVRPPEAIADKLKSLLGRTVTLKLENVSVNALFDALPKSSGAEIILKIQSKSDSLRVSVNGGPMTVAAALQLVEDDLGAQGYKFYVREYGLLLSLASSAPEGAMTLDQFRKQLKSELPAEPMK